MIPHRPQRNARFLLRLEFAMRPAVRSAMAALGAIALAAAVLVARADPALPAWCPIDGIFSITPDQLTAEDFGTDTFTVAKAGGESEDVEVKGRHWSTSLYPPGPSDRWENDWTNATATAAWKRFRSKVEHGETEPIVRNTSDANRARNRRAGLKKVGCP
jgi:hypothetical protein